MHHNRFVLMRLTKMLVLTDKWRQCHSTENHIRLCPQSRLAVITVTIPILTSIG